LFSEVSPCMFVMASFLLQTSDHRVHLLSSLNEFSPELHFWVVVLSLSQLLQCLLCLLLWKQLGMFICFIAALFW
jgi:hypothetical protein